MSAINVRIDRVQIVSCAPLSSKPPDLQGFAITRDSFVRCQTTTSTYARCRHYSSLTTDAKIYWQYCRQKGWLKPWKITMVADDKTGLSRDEIERVLNHCRRYQFLTVEIAIDFSVSTRVNRRFIRGHAVFGKSRRCVTKNDRLRYGSRKSSKLVRCYEKPEVEAYRVELELHSGLLRSHGIAGLEHLVHLPDVIRRKHLQFVDLDWNQLRLHLANKIGNRNDVVIAGARRRRTSILRVQRYLRRKGVSNAHRFLVPHALNEDVRRALNEWTRKFNNGALLVNTK
jgi:hypothetical protein